MRSIHFQALSSGEHSKGYARIALMENTHRPRQAIRSIRGFPQAGTNQVALSEVAAS